MCYCHQSDFPDGWSFVGFFFVCFIYSFLAALHSMQHLSSPSSNQTVPLAVEVQNPNHWTAREFPGILYVFNTTNATPVCS